MDCMEKHLAATAAYIFSTDPDKMKYVYNKYKYICTWTWSCTYSEQLTLVGDIQ